PAAPPRPLRDLSRGPGPNSRTSPARFALRRIFGLRVIIPTGQGRPRPGSFIASVEFEGIEGLFMRRALLTTVAAMAVAFPALAQTGTDAAPKWDVQNPI